VLDIGNEVAVDMIRLIDATTPKEELLHDSLNDAIELIASPWLAMLHQPNPQRASG